MTAIEFAFSPTDHKVIGVVAVIAVVDSLYDKTDVFSVNPIRSFSLSAVSRQSY